MPLRHHEDWRARLWREWCFYRVAFSHFRIRLWLMLIILSFGAIAFIKLEPQKSHTPQEAVYFTWLLIFGEPPEEFPESGWLQLLFFVIPILGLTLIIEGIVDFALMLRDRKRNERGWCSMMASAYRNHIVLVGLGRLGYKTYQLLRQLGQRVVVIERQPDNQFLEEVRRDGTPLFIGDARREAILEDANIRAAQSILLATTDDLANLEIALDARRANPEVRVVLRMFDQNMADKVRDGFNIHEAMSQSAISAPVFAMSAIVPGTVNSFVMGDQLVAAQSWEVKSGGPLCNRTVAGVLDEYSCSVIEVTPGDGRGSRKLFPGPGTMLQDGDTVLLQGSLDTLARLSKRSTGR